jgi:hypothetical protein
MQRQEQGTETRIERSEAVKHIKFPTFKLECMKMMFNNAVMMAA